MSIQDNRTEYLSALRDAETEFPHRSKYANDPRDCNHDFSFIVFCDGGDWDIARCLKCGAQKIVRCTFDDDYD